MSSPFIKWPLSTSGRFVLGSSGPGFPRIHNVCWCITSSENSLSKHVYFILCTIFPKYVWLCNILEYKCSRQFFEFLVSIYTLKYPDESQFLLYYLVLKTQIILIFWYQFYATFWQIFLKAIGKLKFCNEDFICIFGWFCKHSRCRINLSS